MDAGEHIRAGVEALKRYTEERLNSPHILDIPGGWIEVPRDADEETRNQAAALFVRGQQIGARALMEEMGSAVDLGRFEAPADPCCDDDFPPMTITVE